MGTQDSAQVPTPASIPICSTWTQVSPEPLCAVLVPASWLPLGVCVPSSVREVMCTHTFGGAVDSWADARSSSTGPRGSDAAHHTPSSLLPLECVNVTAHTCRQPSPWGLLTHPPCTRRHLPQGGSGPRAQPGTHGPEMPANVGAVPEQGSRALGPTAKSGTSPGGRVPESSSSGPRMLFLGEPCGLWGQMGDQGPEGPADHFQTELVLPAKMPLRRPPPPSRSLVPALSSPCPSISEFWVFLGLS